MLKKIIIATLVFFGGPSIAWLILSAGCSAPGFSVGEMCGHNMMTSFIFFSVAIWLLISLAIGLISSLKAESRH
jgi:hypothetical protein